jgi:P4 family phage/plasmid primase-like protien
MPDDPIRDILDGASYWRPELLEPVGKPEAVPSLEGQNPYSDGALALTFSGRHAHELRYCDQHGAWYIWDGARWSRDVKRRVFTLARATCHDAAAGANTARDKAAVNSAKTVAAVVNLARCDARHAILAEDLDRDPWALNTPGGIVDLRTGKIHPSDPMALCSKVTACTPLHHALRPRWNQFLDDVTAGDKGLQRYLARLAGYGLTGSTREHVLAFLHGQGGNGKGVFLNSLTAVLGDYARVSPMEVFTDCKSDRHPTELAMLQGARLVTAQETEDGRRWAESKIKALTGGDAITARFMRGDFFTFTPQFKLLFAGNHKPALRNVDEAMRRRLHLVPFTVTIPAEKRDPTLPEKLKDEWPAILAWAIDGCLEWQRIGLAPPAAVLAATDEYLSDEDSFGTWLSECCERDSFSFEITRGLFASWKAWAERAGLQPGTEKRFVGNLRARGLEKTREGGTGRMGFAGVRLIRTDYSDDPRYGA